MLAAIEKKSTGTTLVSILNDIQGLNVIAIERTIQSLPKNDRFICIQPYIAQKLVTLPYGAKHTKQCIDHMSKITANGSERRNDIADTCFDACRVTFIDKTAVSFIVNNVNSKEQAKSIMRSQLLQQTQRAERWD